MERRYHETDSNTVREELAKYLTTSDCTCLQWRTFAARGAQCFFRRKKFAGNYGAWRSVKV